MVVDSGANRDIFKEVALVLNRSHLTSDRRQQLEAQVNVECYRADKLIAWARKSSEDIQAHVIAWTEEIFAWAKDDQDFYTALNAEIK